MLGVSLWFLIYVLGCAAGLLFVARGRFGRGPEVPWHMLWGRLFLWLAGSVAAGVALLGALWQLQHRSPIVLYAGGLVLGTVVPAEALALGLYVRVLAGSGLERSWLGASAGSGLLGLLVAAAFAAEEFATGSGGVGERVRGAVSPAPVVALFSAVSMLVARLAPPLWPGRLHSRTWRGAIWPRQADDHR